MLEVMLQKGQPLEPGDGNNRVHHWGKERWNHVFTTMNFICFSSEPGLELASGYLANSVPFLHVHDPVLEPVAKIDRRLR